MKKITNLSDFVRKNKIEEREFNPSYTKEFQDYVRDSIERSERESQKALREASKFVFKNSIRNYF